MLCVMEILSLECIYCGSSLMYILIKCFVPARPHCCNKLQFRDLVGVVFIENRDAQYGFVFSHIIEIVVSNSITNITFCIFH